MADNKKKIKTKPLIALLTDHFGKRVYNTTRIDNGVKSNEEFMLINEREIEFYYATKKVDNDVEVIDVVKLVKSYDYTMFDSVIVDKFALSTKYLFNTGLEIWVGASDDLTAALRANDIPTEILVRKWYNKILGYRSKKKWKMVTASVGYFLMFAILIGLFTDNEAQTTLPEASEASAEVEQDEQTDKEPELTPEEKAKLAEEEEKKKAEEEAAQKAEEERIAKEEAEAKAAAEAEKARKAEALKMSGSGDSVTKTFELDAGFVIFDISLNGGGHAAVQLIDEMGNNEELMVNTIGPYQGKTIALVPSYGNYLLNVTAEGEWAAQGSQEFPEEFEEGTISGSGDDVRFVYIENGLRTFNFDYKGDGHFAVLANANVLLANEIGPYSGSTAEKVEDSSVYIISVTSEGDWTVGIQ